MENAIKKTSFKDIKPEFDELFLSIEKWSLLIWFFVSIYFTNLMVYESNGIIVLRNLMLEYFNVIPTIFQVWLIWYFILFITCLVLNFLIQEIFYLIYKINPNWW